MKISAFSLIFLFFLTSCFSPKGENVFPWSNETKEVSGAVIEKEFKGDFDKIKVAQAIEAELIKSEEERVVISAPKSVIDEVLVDNDNGNLFIHLKPNVNFETSHRIKAKVFVKDFNVLQASSAASIFSKEQFTQEETAIDVSSSGSINGYFEANKMSINVSSAGTFKGKIWAINLDAGASSSGSINTEGKVKNATIECSSAGSFRGNDVIVQHAVLDVSSAGSIDLTVEETLDAEASSGGGINIKSNGKKLQTTNSKESSGGSVNIN